MWSDGDRRQLDEAGIATAEVERQLDLLRAPARYVQLIRPCTPGDGIERIAPEARHALHERYVEAARSGRCVKFVPASGAATRMFRELLHYQRGAGRESTWSEIRREAREGRAEAVTLVEFLSRVRELPFHERLRRTLFRDGESLEGLARVGAFQPVLDALLGAAGMDYASLPKGLLEFHTYPIGPRTAFEEHLVEAADYIRDGSSNCRLHFTVSPEHWAGFARLLENVGPTHAVQRGVKFQVGWSVQKPRTDTLAVEASGEPVRDAHGRLRLRPGGHGALIDNLSDLEGDLVFVKNIDNVQPDRSRPLATEWKRLLCGLLLRVQGDLFRHLRQLRDAGLTEEGLRRAEAWAVETLGVKAPAANVATQPETRRAELITLLERPLRVCGVVRNTGEPGGGPFWVRSPDGTASRQIVESAQVDPQDRRQGDIFRTSTHFNPVDLVCGLRDASGRPFALERFVDRDAVIVTHKSEGGRDVRVLERPGLWNGGMAFWNTVLVEVPNETFTPVKTVLDLLRPEHLASVS